LCGYRHLFECWSGCRLLQMWTMRSDFHGYFRLPDDRAFHATTKPTMLPMRAH
jgi:hypothetical protein